MNFKLKKIHLFVILLIALIGCCIQMPQFNLGFNLGFKEGYTVNTTMGHYKAKITDKLMKDDSPLPAGRYKANVTGTRSGSGSDMRVEFRIDDSDTNIRELYVSQTGEGYNQGEEIFVNLYLDAARLQQRESKDAVAVDGATGEFTFILEDTTAVDDDPADTEKGKSTFQEEGRMNPLVLFNTMVNGESNSSITEIKDYEDEEVQGNAQFTMQNRDLMGSPINLSESSPSRSVSVKNKNKNKNPFSQLFDGLANIFGGKKEGMENEGNPAYPGKEGEEDQWILKSKIVPPVCPKCPEPTCDTKKCPPCPSCERCPEPAFECKKVPNYRSTNDNYLPRPVLADFSQFGM